MANKPMPARLMVGESLEHVLDYVKDSALLFVEIESVCRACDSPAKLNQTVALIRHLQVNHAIKYFHKR